MRIAKEIHLIMVVLLLVVFSVTAIALSALASENAIAHTTSHDASSWSVAAIGIIGLTLVLFLWSRIRLRILAPLFEIAEVLSQVESGNSWRRVHLEHAADDVHLLAERLNKSFDKATSTTLKDE
ncbi:MAG: hypothetical protein IPJ88_01830 [Myxococcales bacterium]|nr:MAG: hypothetical protein IPJ88_01830 [Myxococcales bacterium]